MNRITAAFAAGALLFFAPLADATGGQKEKRGMNTQTKKEAVIACRLGALDAARRERHQSLRKRLNDSVQEVRELPDGYALRLPAETEMILATAEWVTLERLCCPFFVFELEIGDEGAPMWLRLTGGEGVKEFLRAELGLKQ
ncbi:MAG TPA: hypothetical protein VFQ92_04880 [Blastocatellia bacterium]|nr:hypothetical protein [Blastocatellia bacterium]